MSIVRAAGGVRPLARRVRVAWIAVSVGFAAAVPLPAQLPPPEILWVQGGPYRLRVTVNTGAHVGERPILVVALHGDLGGREQDTFAARAATVGGGDVIAIGLLRPGYTDTRGRKSDGEMGLTTGDNYNATNTDAIAAAIVALERRFHPRRVVLAGHSGGAAMVANILGRHPDIADAALLASCPCDVDLWRQHMLERTKFDGFKGKIATLSPVDEIPGMSDRVRVTMVVGTHDQVAPPSLSEEYQERAAKLGKRVRLVKLEGKDHEIFLDPAVLTELTPLLR